MPKVREGVYSLKTKKGTFKFEVMAGVVREPWSAKMNIEENKWAHGLHFDRVMEAFHNHDKEAPVPERVGDLPAKKE